MSVDLHGVRLMDTGSIPVISIRESQVVTSRLQLGFLFARNTGSFISLPKSCAQTLKIISDSAKILDRSLIATLNEA